MLRLLVLHCVSSQLVFSAPGCAVLWILLIMLPKPLKCPGYSLTRNKTLFSHNEFLETQMLSTLMSSGMPLQGLPIDVCSLKCQKTGETPADQHIISINGYKYHVITRPSFSSKITYTYWVGDVGAAEWNKMYHIHPQHGKQIFSNTLSLTLTRIACHVKSIFAKTFKSSRERISDERNCNSSYGDTLCHLDLYYLAFKHTLINIYSLCILGAVSI